MFLVSMSAWTFRRLACIELFDKMNQRYAEQCEPAEDIDNFDPVGSGQF